VNHDLQAWIEMFFRRRRVFAYSSGWILVLFVIALMLCPPFFSSTAEIVVQQDRAPLLVSSDIQGEQNGPPPGPEMPVQEQYLNSEIELLTSFYLIEHTLDGLTPGIFTAFRLCRQLEKAMPVSLLELSERRIVIERLSQYRQLCARYD
jgi:hypothetical protein